MHRLVRNVRFEFPVDEEASTALCHFHLFERDKHYIAIATDLPSDEHGASLSRTIADFATCVARDFVIEPTHLRVFAHYGERAGAQAVPGRIDGESFAEAAFRWIRVYNAGARIELPRAMEPRWSATDRAALEELLGGPLK